MKKEAVLILLLLKPMTKTSQLNDIAIMIYHDGRPVLKNINSFFFAIISRFFGMVNILEQAQFDSKSRDQAGVGKCPFFVIGFTSPKQISVGDEIFPIIG